MNYTIYLLNMRYLLCLLIISPTYLFSQRFALIDKNLKVPILYTDSVTVEQAKKGFFPIENKSVDTLVANIVYLNNILKVRQRSKMKSFELRSSNVVIKTQRVPYSYGDRYDATMESMSNEIIAQFSLISHLVSNKQSVKRLQKILNYFKENKSFFMDPYEVRPKTYNVVVIVE
jgi:hypothetical protein